MDVGSCTLFSIPVRTFERGSRFQIAGITGAISQGVYYPSLTSCAILEHDVDFYNLCWQLLEFESLKIVAEVLEGERATKRHCRRCDLLDELYRPLIRCCHWKKRITAVAVVTFPGISIFIMTDSSLKMMLYQMDYVKRLTSPTL